MSKANAGDAIAGGIESLPFEDAVKKLETIVDAMESQAMPLESLLTQYEEGAQLVRYCQARLNEAELRIQQLEKTAKGEIAVKPASLDENLSENA
jgi:exodeoxyribonuclease VII small subunit